MASRMDDRTLEATLVEIGRDLAYPRPTRMADAVRVRIRASRPVRRPWTVRLAPAFFTFVLLALAVAVASPGVRSAARDFLHRRGVDIFPVPSVPAPTTHAPSASPIAIPGERVSLEAARARMPFAIRLPVDFGEPDAVYIQRIGTTEAVALVYLAGPGRPAPSNALPDVAALVVEVRAGFDDSFIGKGLGPGTTVEQVKVGGAPGDWIQGQPHFVFYRDAQGNYRQDTVRLAGNTLIWVEGDVTLRLEAQLGRDAALAIAEGFR